MLDAQSGDVGAAAPVQGDEPSAPIANAYNKRKRVKGAFHADRGGASRFFYVAKAPKSDKTSGGLVTNDHPTAKNTELMRWLVRLITPPGGVVLDSFMGSGSTGAACALEHVSFIGFDLDAHFVDDIATPRIAAAYEAIMTGDDAEDTTDIDMLAPTTIPPFLRWVGGKRRQALDLAARATAALKPGGRYIEPFLGSGAVALAMPPETPMLLGDACLPLGYLWWWLQRHPREIAEYAAGYGLALDQDWNTQEGFNELRQQHNAQPYSDESWEPSARFLWLTCASFNGVYRESSKGEYNVPWGRRARVSVPTPETLEAVAAHIAQAQIFPGWDFEDVIDQATAGDVVFADSPYDGPKGQFTSYVKTPFDADAQLRLMRAAMRARERGATVILTNSDTVRIRDFYAGWTIESALERRPVAADPERRVPAYCVVISGGPLG
jgi:DNA adenine methylase Dam